MNLDSDLLGFKPTPASIPSEHCNYRPQLPKGLPVHVHPLVRSKTLGCKESNVTVTFNRILLLSYYEQLKYIPTS